SKLVAELAQQAEELLPGCEPPRDETGGPLGRVPGPEVLDHGLRVDRRLRVGRELPHRRRATQPLGARLELTDDLVVRVPLADARLELGELARIDPRHRAKAGAARPANSVGPLSGHRRRRLEA